MQLHPRNAEPLLTEALADTPVVVLQGARQCGKSTLAEQTANRSTGTVLTMDDGPTRSAASLDPQSFVESLGPGLTVIDEIQRVPSLILPIKASVDRDRRPGRFLLTGSADLLRAPGAEDSLAGRAQTIRLHPLSQGELANRHDDFVTAWLRGVQAGWETDMTRAQLVSAICAGGMPEARRRQGRRRAGWLRDYLDRLLRRDAADITRVSPELLRRAMDLLAAEQSSEFVAAHLARFLGGSESSAMSYVDKLRALYLVESIPAWSRSRTQRAVRKPKMIVADSGLAAELAGLDEELLLSPTGAVHLGGALEGFVAGELVRQQTWSRTDYTISHFRESGGAEVDLVLELRGGKVLGLEVKATSSPGRQHASGLERLKDRLGADLLGGIVLHTGTRSFSMGEGIWAVPIPALWQL